VSENRRHLRGFTLLELLVATAMTAVLAGSLYATLHIAFKARRTADAAVGQMWKAELAVERIRIDLESAVVPKGILAGGFLGEDGTDASGQPRDALILHCTATGATETEGAGDIRMVELICEAADDSEGMILVRRVSRHLLATGIEEPPGQTLCRGVRSLDLKYHNGTDWEDSWDSTTHSNSLPLAVRVTLELIAEDGQNAGLGGYTVSRVFQIACAFVPDSPQAETAP